jgi:hypothetical protein
MERQKGKKEGKTEGRKGGRKNGMKGGKERRTEGQRERRKEGRKEERKKGRKAVSSSQLSVISQFFPHKTQRRIATSGVSLPTGIARLPCS